MTEMLVVYCLYEIRKLLSHKSQKSEQLMAGL